MIKNIVFDMGQVLIRFDRDYLIGRLGLTPEDGKLLMNEVLRSVEWARTDRGTMTEEEGLASVCRRLPERLHGAAAELFLRWDRPIRPVEGMAELIKELKNAGYRLYLLSNASFRQHEYWQRVPGHEFFDDTLVSCDVGSIKPEREIFRVLFERFGLKPEECFFVDDSPLNIEAAFFCGMPGAVFNDDVPALREAMRSAGIRVS